METPEIIKRIDEAKEVIRRDLNREVIVHAIALIGSEVRVLVSEVGQEEVFSDIVLNAAEDLRFGPLGDEVGEDSEWSPDDDIKQIGKVTRAAAFSRFKGETERWYDFLQGNIPCLKRIGLEIYYMEDMKLAK